MSNIWTYFDQYSVAKFVAGCLAARDSVLAKA